MMRTCLPMVLAALSFMPALAADIGSVPPGVGFTTAKLAPNAFLPNAFADATVMTDAAGRTLYVLASDQEMGKSACNGECARAWPPFAAPADAAPVGQWSIFPRDDGSRQWAFKGKPLYLHARDQKPGEAKGHNVLQIWTAVIVPPGAAQAAAK